MNNYIGALSIRTIILNTDTDNGFSTKKMKKILSIKKLDFNFFRHNLHTVRKGVLKIFGKIKNVWVNLILCFSPEIFRSFLQLEVMPVEIPVKCDFSKLCLIYK